MTTPENLAHPAPNDAVVAAINALVAQLPADVNAGLLVLGSDTVRVSLPGGRAAAVTCPRSAERCHVTVYTLVSRRRFWRRVTAKRQPSRYDVPAGEVGRLLFPAGEP